MKKYNISLVLLLLAFTMNGQKLLDKQVAAENIKDVVLFNFEGDMNITASSNDKISVKVVLEDGEMSDYLTLNEIKKTNLYGVYLQTPCMVDPNLENFNPERPFRLMNGKKDCEWENFDLRDMPNLTFNIQIPQHINVYISTINEGEIKLENINGKIHANNVNGGISINNCNRIHEATTVNGNVNVVYSSVPEVNGIFKTINGDIELTASENANVNAQFKSFSGDFYTDFDEIDVNQNVNKETTLKEGKLIHINEYTDVRVGKGGFELAIETFNGNAYLHKK